jgi:hypothetical protein
VFKRPVDAYDVGQTILLCVAFYVIVRRIERRFQRLSPNPRPKIYRTPAPPVTPRRTSRVRYSARDRDSAPIREWSPGYQARFQNLLRQVGGDYATVTKLVEYERVRKPDASDVELLENALWRWESGST